MKKYLSLSLALAVAILSFSPNRERKTANLDLYWFKYDESTCSYTFDRYSLNPTVFCVGFLYPCAAGYILEPPKNGKGQYIYPSIPPDIVIFKGEEAK